MNQNQNQNFQQAIREIPACVDYDPLTTRTLEDLRWAVLLQLDLIEEGQDGTEYDDLAAVRRWLKKWKNRTPAG